MAWLEITLDTTPERIGSVVTTLTARGFSDLVIEDQQEFETFLEENRAYWDYIDEELQEKLQGLGNAAKIGMQLCTPHQNGAEQRVFGGFILVHGPHQLEAQTTCFEPAVPAAV